MNNNSKTRVNKNNKGLYFIDKSNSKTNIKNIYYLNKSINKINKSNNEKNNYKISKINYNTSEKNNKKKNSKSKFNNISYKKIIKASFNSNNTNNDTKGFSSSILSTKENKTNSKRYYNQNINIQNKREHWKNIPDNRNKNTINRTNIRLFTNDYNINKNDKKINNENIDKSNKTSNNNNFVIIKDKNNLKMTSKVVEDCFNNCKKQKNKESEIKVEKSMSLQSLSDSKMLDLAEHYINSKDDCLDDIGIKKILFKKKSKNENKI